MVPPKKVNKAKSKRSQSVTNPTTKTPNLSPYKLIKEISKRTKKEIYSLEVDGVMLKYRSTAKGISYWECESHRKKNAPDCFFRGKIANFDSAIEKGQIEILSDHSKTCKYLANNETSDFSKNNGLKPRTQLYKKMKIEIEKKLEEENWLSIFELNKLMISTFEIDQHLSYAQVSDIVKDWRKVNDVAKDSYILAHQLNKENLPFFRGIMTQNF
jgi:hypothetical protein